MTPIDGRRNPRGEQWGKRVPGLGGGKKRPGCLSVLIPTIPARGFPRTRFRVAGRPTLTSPLGRPAL